METLPTTQDAFLGELQNKLMTSSDMISSANTGLENALRSSISKVQESTTKGSEAIGLQYDRQIGYAQQGFNDQLTASRERGVGIQTSDIAYKRMAEEADKNLKDLDMRKRELMLQNDAQGASKIADLEFQTMKMKTDAMQQTFSNLLSLGNYGLNVAQEKRAIQSQTFQEQSSIAGIALKYGITVQPGESLQSVISRAAPMADKLAQAELAKTLAEAQKAKAEAAKVASGSSSIGDPGFEVGFLTMAQTDPNRVKDMMSKTPALVKYTPTILKNLAASTEMNVYNGLKSGDTYENIVKNSPEPYDLATFNRAALAARDKYISELSTKPKEVKGLFPTAYQSAKELKPSSQGINEYLFGSANYLDDFYSNLSKTFSSENLLGKK